MEDMAEVYKGKDDLAEGQVPRDQGHQLQIKGDSKSSCYCDITLYVSVFSFLIKK